MRVQRPWVSTARRCAQLRSSCTASKPGRPTWIERLRRRQRPWCCAISTIDDKSNEMPAVGPRLGELGLAASVGHVDARALSNDSSVPLPGARLIAQAEGQPCTTLRGDVQRSLRRARAATAMRPPTPARARDTPHRARSTQAPRDRMDPSSPPSSGSNAAALVRNTATGLWNLASETSYHVSNAVFIRPRRRRRHPGTLGD